MFQGSGLTLKFYLEQIGLTQVGVTPIPPIAPAQTSILYAGPSFFMALISGIILAFAFQLLLTNLSVASGLSYLGQRSRRRRAGSQRRTTVDLSPEDTPETLRQRSGVQSFADTVRQVETAVGVWTLITVSLALFLACLLAVKLSLVVTWSLGVIIALVIWGAYFTLLVWLSSTTLGSLIGSVVNSAISGFRSILTTATSALGQQAANRQMVNTAEAAAAAVRRELLGSAEETERLRGRLEDYLGSLRRPELNLRGMREWFEDLLNDPELRSLASSQGLRRINRQTFVDLVSHRTDFSPEEVERIVDQLESVWNRFIGRVSRPDPIQRLLDYLKSAPAVELKSEQLSRKLDSLIEELRQQRRPPEGEAEAESGLMAQLRQLGTSALMGALLGRTDLSDLDVEQIYQRLRQLLDQITGQTAAAPALPLNTVRADVERYLQNAYRWHLNRETLRQEFREVLYDPEADPGLLRRQLEDLSRQTFVEQLNQRGDLQPQRLEEIADQLEGIRQEVLAVVGAAEAEQESQNLRTRVEDYLRSTGREELNPEGIERDVRTILSDPEAGFDALRDRINQMDRGTLIAVLSQREDISEGEADRIVGQIEATRDRVLNEAQELQERARSEVEALWVKLESYLRHTQREELNPEGIKRDLQTLIHDPRQGAIALRDRIARFDRQTLVQLLSQRQDLSQDQVNQVIDQVEAIWSSTRSAPQQLARQAQDQYERFIQAIADYLRRTERAELDPEGIRHDLTTLVHDPRAGTVALRERLAHIDRETLVQLLSQREDLTEAEVNQLIDQVQEGIRYLIRAPRRLAMRTQEQLVSLESDLENYLRNTAKEELDPEGIKRDLQLLFTSPRAGLENLGERLSQFDRSTFVALLAQRPDMTEADANRIADQILAVRDQFVEQVRSLQSRIQAVIDGLFERVRHYLNSLERPELNYDSIRRDLRQLFEDPQAGFAALRDRLSHFNRETLVAVLGSLPNLTPAEVDRIISQIEAVRNRLLQRAERVQLETQRRLQDLQRQAEQQAEETRKAATMASWWLFATGLVSAATAALGGLAAVLI